MKKLIWLLLCVSAFAQIKNPPQGGQGAFAGGAGASFQDAQRISSPSAPASGYNRIYMDSATGNLACKKSDGTSCFVATAAAPFITSSANPASTGVVRMSNNVDKVCWNNSAGLVNLCVYVTSANLLNMDAGIIAPSITLSGQAGTGSRCLHVDASGNVSATSTDCGTSTSGSALLKGNGSGGITNAVAGTDYVPPSTTVNGKSLASNVSLNLASSDFANQGTGVYHGNGASTPTFGPVTTADAPTLAPLASPTFTGTVTSPALVVSGVSGSTQCLHVNSSGLISGTGADCPSGGGNVSASVSLTSTAFTTGAGTNNIQTPSTSSTLDSSGNASFAGTVTGTEFDGSGTTAGYVGGVGAASAPSLKSNSFGWLAPSSSSFTAYAIQAPSVAPPASTVPKMGTASGGITPMTFGKVTSDFVDSSIAPTASPTFTGTTTIPALLLSTITGSAQCLHVDASGNVSGTGSDCGAGGGGSLSGLTTNRVLKATSSTDAGNSSIIDDGNTVTHSEPVVYGSTPDVAMVNSGTSEISLEAVDGSGNLSGTNDGNLKVGNLTIGGTCVGCASTHALLSATHTDTTAASAVRGDGLFAIGATPTWQRLAHPSVTGGYFKWNGTDIVASTMAASGTGTPTACTNQAVTGFTLNADAAPTSTCSTITSSYVDSTIAKTTDLSSYVPTTRTVNGNALSSNVTILLTPIWFGVTTGPACANGGGTTTFIGMASSSTTEASVIRFVAPQAMTIKNFSAKINGNVPASQSVAIKISKNASTTGTPSITIAAGASTGSDTSTSLSLAAGDLVDVSLNCSGGTSALTGPVQLTIGAQ